MIKDKNTFECIFLNDHIWFPNYVIWGPPSHGHQRRKYIFKQAFPTLDSSITSKQSWKDLLDKHSDKRKLFKYDDVKKKLTEISLNKRI